MDHTGRKPFMRTLFHLQEQLVQVSPSSTLHKIMQSIGSLVSLRLGSTQR